MSSLSPASILYDSSGNAVGVVQDGAFYRLRTEAKLATGHGLATEAKQDSLLTELQAKADLTETQPISAASLPLPTGASTEAKQDSAITELQSLLTELQAKADLTERQPVILYDSNGVALEVKEGTAIPANTNGLLMHGRDSGGNARVAEILVDSGVNYVRTDAVVSSAPAPELNNLIDSNNSSTSQLTASASFTGTGTDVSGFAAVAVTVHSDKDSAADGMKFQFSMDNTNWDDSYNFNLEASSSQTRRFQFPVCAQYFRVYYINGSETTTQFRVQTILQRDNILTSIHRVENVVKEDRSAQLVKSVIIAQRAGATVQDFYPVKSDVSGNLKVTTIGTDVPSDPSSFVLKYCVNGSSHNMLVDGSSTPVNFERGPTTTDEVWSVRELLLTFTADDFAFDGVSFGPNAALTNGLSVNVVKNSVLTQVFNVVQNEDFLRVPGRTPLVNNTGPKDVLGASIAFQGLVLNQSTSDIIRVIVRDNLTSVKFKFLAATLFAVKVV